MSLRYRHFLKNTNTNNFIIIVDTTHNGVTNNNQFQFTGAVGRYDVIATKLNVPNINNIETFSNLLNQQTITFNNGPGLYELKIKPKGLNNTTRFRRLQFFGLTNTSVGTNLLNTNNWTLNGNWQGNYTSGFFRSPLSGTHTLTNSLQAVVGNNYYLNVNVSNNTTGGYTLSFGGTSITPTNIINTNLVITATTTDNLVITPTANFNGTISIQIRLGDANKITQIKQWGDVKWVNMERAFGFCKNMTITATDTPDLSQCTSLYNTFESCSELTTIGNQSWNTSTITDMRAMFKNCSIFNQDISQFETHNVTQITSNAGDGEGMFQNCTQFNNGGQPLLMDGNKWNLSGVSRLDFMFFGAQNFNQEIYNWDVSNVTNMQSMFRNAYVFNKDLNSWNVSNVENMSSMFWDARNFNKDLNSWNTQSVIRFDSMFRMAWNFNGRINNWVTHNATTMDSMFRFGRSFNNGGQPMPTDGNKWDVSNVTRMNSMFRGTTLSQKFNQDISSWDVSKVENMQFMFNSCEFNNGGQSLNFWDVGLVTDMQSMFACNILQDIQFNQDISYWDVSNVENMSSMFNNNTEFDQDISSWIVSNVKNMSSMFRMGVFNQDISDWDVSKVTDMSQMFGYNNSFNKPFGSWNTVAVTDMSQMFVSTGAFNQNLGSLNVRNVNNFSSFLNNKSAVAFDAANLDAIYNGWTNLINQTIQPNLIFNAGVPGALKHTLAGLPGRDLLTRPNIVINIVNVFNNGSGLIRVVLSSNHGLVTNDKVIIQNVVGTTEANGPCQITVINPTTFDIIGSSFEDTYLSGGDVRTGFGWTITDGGI